MFACDFEKDQCGLDIGTRYPSWQRVSSKDDPSAPNDAQEYNNYMLFDSRQVMGAVSAR